MRTTKAQMSCRIRRTGLMIARDLDPCFWTMRKRILGQTVKWFSRKEAIRTVGTEINTSSKKPVCRWHLPRYGSRTVDVCGYVGNYFSKWRCESKTWLRSINYCSCHKQLMNSEGGLGATSKRLIDLGGCVFVTCTTLVADYIFQCKIEVMAKERKISRLMLEFVGSLSPSSRTSNQTVDNPSFRWGYRLPLHSGRYEALLSQIALQTTIATIDTTT